MFKDKLELLKKRISELIDLAEHAETREGFALSELPLMVAVKELLEASKFIAQKYNNQKHFHSIQTMINMWLRYENSHGRELFDDLNDKSRSIF